MSERRSKCARFTLVDVQRELAELRVLADEIGQRMRTLEQATATLVVPDDASQSTAHASPKKRTRPDSPASCSPRQQRLVCIYSDGSSLSNGQRGAAAGSAVVGTDGFEWSDRCPGTQTNQRAELFAACVAMARANNYARSAVLTDSEYVERGINDPTRLAVWRANGWKKRSGGRAANTDLWSIMAALLEVRRDDLRHWPPVEVRHVPAHSGIEGNERADQLAKDAAARCKQRTITDMWPSSALGFTLAQLM